MADSSGVSNLLATIKSLPPMPSGVARLLSLSQADPSYFEKASAIVRADPALAGQVIKMANSALYGGRAPVESLDRAVMRVGIRMVVGVLTSAHLQRSFDPKDERMAPIWLANVCSAVVCRSLAERCASLQIVPEVAYTYGLLHDVGRLVMVALFRNGMTDLAEENPHPVDDLAPREEELFGFSHNLAGRLLGNRWNFPPTMTLVMAAHHVAPKERHGYPDNVDRMIDLVNLSDLMAFAIGGATVKEEAEATARVDAALAGEHPAMLLERLDLQPSMVLSAVEPSLRQIERQCRVLGIPEGPRISA